MTKLYIDICVIVLLQCVNVCAREDIVTCLVSLEIIIIIVIHIL